MKEDAAGSREEPGCLRFDLLQDITDPTRFIFYEVYKNGDDAIDFHKNTPHYAKWTAFKETKPNPVESQTVTKLNAIDFTSK